MNSSKSVGANLYNGASSSKFYPLRFFFCENWQSALPLISLQYHDVELRITWGSEAAASKWEIYANYAYLDTQEREFFAANPQNMIITQVQKAIASGAKIQELNFNHPVKYLAAGDATAVAMVSTTGNKLKLQINGTDVSDFKFADPNFTSVPLYYHTTNGNATPGTKLFVYPFCLETGKLQPTGSLNFSRLDSARIVNDTANSDKHVYAVNYTVLRIENGMGGLLYSNYLINRNVEHSFPPRHRFCIDVRSQVQDTRKVCWCANPTHREILSSYALPSRAICPEPI